MKWQEFLKLVGSKEVNEFHHRSDVDSSFKAQHHTLGKKHDQAAPGDHTHDGITSQPIDVSGLVHQWKWSDRFTITNLNNLSKALTYEPVAESLVVRWHPRGGAGLPVLDEDFDLENNIVTPVSHEYYEVGDLFSFQYEVKQKGTIDVVDRPSPPDSDTPGTITVGTLYDDAVLGRPNVLGYWPLNDPIDSLVMTDISGNARHGVYIDNGFTTLGEDGLLSLPDDDTCVLFDGRFGVNALGYVPYGSWMNALPFTIEIWVKTLAISSGILALPNRDTDGRSWQWLATSGGGISFEKIQSGSVASSAAGTLDDTDPHMVAVSYDGANIKQYIDGALVVTTPATGDPATTGKLGIGGTWVGSIDWWYNYNYKGWNAKCAMYGQAEPLSEINRRWIIGTTGVDPAA